MLVHLHNSSFSFYGAMISFAMFNTHFIILCPEGVEKRRRKYSRGTNVNAQAETLPYSPGIARKNVAGRKNLKLKEKNLQHGLERS
jgi:hypothetical protein